MVGVPDGSAEHVACAIAPNYEHEPALSRADVHQKIEEHFRKVSADLPFWKRVKTMHIWEGELPKTAKRNVKRRDVVAELVRLRRRPSGDGAHGRRRPRPRRPGSRWLLDIVAQVSGKPRGGCAPAAAGWTRWGSTA